jgi:ATP synthase F1 gamma subunit
VGSVRHGSAGLKELKNRMRSIRNVQKITKTMKLVASARLKAAQTAMERSRPFGTSGLVVVNDIQTQKESITQKKEGLPSEKKKHLIIPISTDRGLCGSINSGIVKNTRAYVNDLKKKGIEVSIASFGEKGTAQLGRYLGKQLVLSASDLSKQPMSFNNAGLFLDKLLGGEEFGYDGVTIIYNKFISMISSQIIRNSVESSASLLDLINAGELQNLESYEIEEQKSTEYRDLFEFSLGVALYTGYVENQASELGARMNSMDTASKNAGEMLKRMSIQYNRGRQAAITTELIEVNERYIFVISKIISGAQALEN